MLLCAFAAIVVHPCYKREKYMNLNADFYFQLEASAEPLYQAMGKVAQKLPEQLPRHPLLQVQSGRAESPSWYLVQAAEFDPEPLTVVNIRVRDIYASEAIAQAILEMLAAERWLDRRGDAYYLTDLGREVTKELLTRGPSLLAQVDAQGCSVLTVMLVRRLHGSRPDRFQNEISPTIELDPEPVRSGGTRTEQPWVDVPPHVDLVRLESLLRRVIDASLMCGTPPGNWCLAHSRNRAPGDEQPAVVRLLQYFSDFNAFRDDTHMAAWQPTGVTGNQWEAFAFVVSGQAETAEALHEQLAYRGYATGDFALAMTELVNRGWLADNDGRYSVTEEGKALHVEVEALTDHYFYAPWHEALSSAELEETVALLRLLREDWDA